MLENHLNWAYSSSVIPIPSLLGNTTGIRIPHMKEFLVIHKNATSEKQNPLYASRNGI